MNQILAETMAQQHEQVDTECAGCLIKIHPMEIDATMIQISSESFSIGRDPSCDYHVNDDSVSRRHGMIERKGRTFYVSDLGSTNGVFVNDTRIDSCELNAGDRIRMGNQIFKFLDQFEAQYHETVYTMMTCDGLTGAYNKRYFSEVLDRSIEGCRRRQRTMALILMDIDHFKRINDTYGHLAGDEVLQELSSRIKSVTREDEVFARFGGEEFALLVCDGDVNEAAELAERCHALVGNAPFNTSAGPLDVTISIGVAEYDLVSQQSALLEKADNKLYQAKNQGRNQVCV